MFQFDDTITKVIAYADTVGLYCWRPLPDNLLAQLRREYGGDLWVKEYEYGWIVEINQPARRTLIQLVPFEQELFCLTRVDIAVDYLTNTTAEATHITTFLKQHLIQNWRRRQESTTVKATAYWSANRRIRRGIAAYGSRPSKVTQQPTAHLELRFKSAAAVKRAKIDLKALIDGIDVRKLLQHQAKLAVIDHLKLRTITMRYAFNTQMENQELALDEINQKLHWDLLRLTDATSLGEISSQALWDVRGFRGCLRRLEWDVFPQPEWLDASVGL